MNRNDNDPDKELDELLQSAKWPELDEEQRDRLIESWEAMLGDEWSDHSSSASLSSPEKKQGENWFKGSSTFGRMIVGAAAALLIGCAVWLVWRATSGDGSLDRQPIAENEKANRPPAVNRNFEAAKVTRSLPQGEHLQVLAEASALRRSDRQISFHYRFVERTATFIGRNENLAAGMQKLALYTDLLVEALRENRSISRKARSRYLAWRADWEKWAWRSADRTAEEDETAMTRFAISVSTRRSLQTIGPLVKDPELALIAANAVTLMGDTSDIDRALANTSDKTAQRTLLESLIEKPGKRPALIYLAYINHPQTRAMAVEVAEASTQIPAFVWLETIASQEPARWEAAIALSQLCDPRIVNSLIQMTMNPETARPAMVALANSQCSHAKDFCTFAANDYQLASQLSSARRKLQRLEDAQLKSEQSQFQGL